MNKTSIKKQLQRSAKGAEFINKSQVKACLGCGNDQVNIYLDELQYIQIGRTKLYDIEEVAGRILGFVKAGKEKIWEG